MMIRMLTAALAVQLCTQAATGDVALYEFTATWCGPCQRVAPVVEKLHREGLPIQKIDVDEEKDLAAKFAIHSVPTFVMVINDKESSRRSGYIPEGELRTWIQRAQASATGISETALNQSDIHLGQAQPMPFPRTSPGGEIRSAIADLKGADETPSISLTNASGTPTVEMQRVVGGDEAATSSQGEVAKDPMDASVRIRVLINGSINLGSGTVISSRPGQTIILSCWHIFRDFKSDSSIEVDFFANGQPVKFSGQLMNSNEQADLSVIVVNTTKPVAISPVAARGHAPAVGNGVVTIGCSGGELPTHEPIKITAVDRYDGPNNLECTGLPVQGRSGGGLFNQLGEIVGVCIAADKDNERGLYSGLLAIHDLLDESGLTELNEERVSLPIDLARADETPRASASEPQGASPFPTPIPADPPVAASAPPVDVRAGDSEVVVIVRDPRNPENPNRIVIIHSPSQTFFDHLDAEFSAGANLDQKLTKIQALSPIGREIRDHSERPNILLSREIRQSHDSPRLVPTSLSMPVGPERYVRTRR